MKMDIPIIMLILAVLCPFICAYVAKNKNKSTIGWFCWGIIFGFFALGVLVFLPSE